MASYANAVLAKARAMYGEMLSPAQYDELMRKQTVQEISAYLREKTPYSAALEGTQDSTLHRGQLENLLHKDLFFQYVRLSKYVRPDEGVYRFIIADMEIELILACLRGIISHRPGEELLASLPTFLQPYACFNLFALTGVQDGEGLLKVLEHTPYGAVLRYGVAHYPPLAGGHLRYTTLELSLRAYYFRTLLQQAEGSAHGQAAKQLREIITLRAELMNLETIWRFKASFDAPPDRIRKLLLPFGCRLSKRDLEALINAKDTEEFRKELEKTPYGKRMPQTHDGAVESITEPIRYARCRHLLRFSTDPQVVYMAFIMLRTMETADMIRIIEGVRYQMPPERIEKLLFKKWV